MVSLKFLRSLSKRDEKQSARFLNSTEKFNKYLSMTLAEHKLLDIYRFLLNKGPVDNITDLDVCSVLKNDHKILKKSRLQKIIKKLRNVEFTTSILYIETFIEEKQKKKEIMKMTRRRFMPKIEIIDEDESEDLPYSIENTQRTRRITKNESDDLITLDMSGRKPIVNLTNVILDYKKRMELDKKIEQIKLYSKMEKERKQRELPSQIIKSHDIYEEFHESTGKSVGQSDYSIEQYKKYKPKSTLLIRETPTIVHLTEIEKKEKNELLSSDRELSADEVLRLLKYALKHSNAYIVRNLMKLDRIRASDIPKVRILLIKYNNRKNNDIIDFIKFALNIQ